jgi:hypothetical protein
MKPNSKKNLGYESGSKVGTFDDKIHRWKISIYGPFNRGVMPSDLGGKKQNEIQYNQKQNQAATGMSVIYKLQWLILCIKGTLSPDYRWLEVISVKSPLLGHVTSDI